MRSTTCTRTTHNSSVTTSSKTTSRSSFKSERGQQKSTIFWLTSLETAGRTTSPVASTSLTNPSNLGCLEHSVPIWERIIRNLELRASTQISKWESHGALTSTLATKTSIQTVSLKRRLQDFWSQITLHFTRFKSERSCQWKRLGRIRWRRSACFIPSLRWTWTGTSTITTTCA